MEPTNEFWIREVVLEQRDNNKLDINVLFLAAHKLAENGTKVTFDKDGYRVVIFDPEQL